MRFDGTQVEQITDNQWEDAGPAWQPRRQAITTSEVGLQQRMNNAPSEIETGGRTRTIHRTRIVAMRGGG